MDKIKQVIFYFCFFVVLAGAFSACYTEKRFSKHLANGIVKFPSTMSKTCSVLYPPKVETIKELIYREGKIDTIWEDIYLDCDTITEVVWKDRVVKVEVPKIIKRVDTLIDHQYHSVENTALVNSLKIKSDSLQSELSTTKISQSKTNTQKNIWLKIAIVLMLYIILKTIIRLVFPTTNYFISKLP